MRLLSSHTRFYLFFHQRDTAHVFAFIPLRTQTPISSLRPTKLVSGLRTQRATTTWSPSGSLPRVLKMLIEELEEKLVEELAKLGAGSPRSLPNEDLDKELAKRGARRRASRGLGFYIFLRRKNREKTPVHDLGRTLQPNPKASSSPALVAMTHACFTCSRFLPVRKNYEGYIPRSCTTALSISPSSSSSSIILCAPSALVVSSHLTSSDAPQRSEEWFALRKDKLTTSTFSTALGFWKGNRRSELWHEKVFAPDTDTIEATARAAMNWGVLQEAAAIDRYKSITGRDVSTLGFAVHAEARFGWLGASPDGLLGCYPGGGILEVKCPYNKGKPELGLPWQAVPYYYMPQVQGQMEIMDRDWVDLYCWTPNGSTLFRVCRERAYWGLMHGILQEFWLGSVVPAREAVLMGREADVKAYEPKPRHDLTGLMIGRSRKLAAEAKLLCRDIGGHIEFYR